ncbi:hypothetical protein VOLCADRAFT_86064 [Volvox carteri f. nagariensis]|uniref:Fatty acid desaturase domain-containing protein n=1 Tax=Volvox carteri f. nagariensis TaxID=3068 RepID=D8THR9_VOLCA|nr:uncharacterized protein VOLCADRAFT_86064 [Volvox carteri f. nagariensis]EFJ52762.1 hypothetical protein VOLCADRAFT_86064 [Volvox carteri f. nagariensis]|eukprot:XP_002945767.1 hypothetical protein VOLCADRAFT_86064 [Volvox carteri f. nagariensis]
MKGGRTYGHQLLVLFLNKCSGRNGYSAKPVSVFSAKRSGNTGKTETSYRPFRQARGCYRKLYWGHDKPLLLLLLSYTLATSASVAMAASHELIHSRNPVHLATAWMFLALYWWYPYYRAHLQHHLHVCTPPDYTCAPKGQDFYSFFLPYYAGSYKEAWHLAVQECNRAGKSKFSPHNRRAALTVAMYGIFGPVAIAVHLTSNFILLVYMAVFDYILHYGLVRQPMPGNSRRYTPITPYTSWNSLYALEVTQKGMTNGVLFNVLLHSDHHLHGVKSYRVLRPPPAPPGGAVCGPCFPGPVNLLALAVFVPPLWMALMDTRADEANAKHMEYLGLTGTTTAELAAVSG